MGKSSGLTKKADPSIVVTQWQKPLEERSAVYIVTGFPRSGTSMMMEALHAGGLPIEYNPDDHSHLEIEKKTGYLPNPHGYFEVGRGAEPWFYPGFLVGRCVKMDIGSVSVMCPGQRYRVILMTREEGALLRSLTTYQDAMDQIGVEKPQLRKALVTAKTGRYKEMLGVAFQHLRNRRDVEHIIEAPYEAVIEKPRELFDKLEEAGWPIDARKAAKVPDGQWNRSGVTGGTTE